MGYIGRPTKYSDSAIQITRQYYSWCVKNNEIPFAEELAIKIGVDDSTLWHWANKHDEFREAYEILITLQTLMLKKKGLSGEYPSSIVRLLLINSMKVADRCQNAQENKQNEGQLESLTLAERKEYSDLITSVFERIYSKSSNVLLG